MREREGRLAVPCVKSARQYLPRGDPALTASRPCTVRVPSSNNKSTSQMHPVSDSLWNLDLNRANMGGLVLLLVLVAGLVTADGKLTIYERLREDVNLSQVFKTFW